MSSSLRTALLLSALALAACGDKDDDDTGSSTDSGTAATGPDCSACSDDELCWYTIDFDDAYITHCDPWPSWCEDDRSCDCLETETSPDEGVLYCETSEVGGAQNTDACEVIDDRPVLFCETRLG